MAVAARPEQAGWALRGGALLRQAPRRRAGALRGQGGVPAGHRALLPFDGDFVILSRLGEEEDGGLCTTRRLEAVRLADLSRFLPMDLTLEPLP